MLCMDSIQMTLWEKMCLNMEDGTTSHGLGLKLMESGEIDALCSLYKHFVTWPLLVLFLSSFLFFSMLGCAAFLASTFTLGEALMAEFYLQEFFSLKASESHTGQLIIIYICLLYHKVLIKSTRKGTLIFLISTEKYLSMVKWTTLQKGQVPMMELVEKLKLEHGGVEIMDWKPM